MIRMRCAKVFHAFLHRHDKSFSEKKWNKTDKIMNEVEEEQQKKKNPLE